MSGDMLPWSHLLPSPVSIKHPQTKPWSKVGNFHIGPCNGGVEYEGDGIAGIAASFTWVWEHSDNWIPRPFREWFLVLSSSSLLRNVRSWEFDDQMNDHRLYMVLPHSLSINWPVILYTVVDRPWYLYILIPGNWVPTKHINDQVFIVLCINTDSTTTYCRLYDYFDTNHCQ